MLIQFKEDLNKLDSEYEQYIRDHVNNVEKAYEWLVNNGIIEDNYSDYINSHDFSKWSMYEFEPYREYFYGKNKDSEKVLTNFNKAWLHHQHNNPHHWQHWVLVNDDEGEARALDMDYPYIIEMICDWWSFSFKKNDLNEIFNWFAEHEDKMILSDKTRTTVNDILDKIKEKLANA